MNYTIGLVVDFLLIWMLCFLKIHSNLEKNINQMHSKLSFSATVQFIGATFMYRFFVFKFLRKNKVFQQISQMVSGNEYLNVMYL